MSRIVARLCSLTKRDLLTKVMSVSSRRDRLLAISKIWRQCCNGGNAVGQRFVRQPTGAKLSLKLCQYKIALAKSRTINLLAQKKAVCHWGEGGYAEYHKAVSPPSRVSIPEFLYYRGRAHQDWLRLYRRSVRCAKLLYLVPHADVNAIKTVNAQRPFLLLMPSPSC